MSFATTALLTLCGRVAVARLLATAFFIGHGVWHGSELFQLQDLADDLPKPTIRDRGGVEHVAECSTLAPDREDGLDVLGGHVIENRHRV
jgi:hypothetical protein